MAPVALPARRTPADERPMTKFVCDHPWTHFEVNNPNGNVTMCCDNNTVLGNVGEASIEEIWNGERYQDIRRQMRDRGAHAICPHTCPVMHGGKGYQRLDWTSDLEEGGAARANAEANQLETAQGLLTLRSLPRWMRFCYSFACNLDCYHCFQREDATQNVKLPQRFMDEVRRLAAVFQVIFPFGGEPFLLKPVLNFLAEAEVDKGCRYFFVTNATLLDDRIFSLLERRRLGLIAVSLDAADAAAFEDLRKRGRKAEWSVVMDNLRRLQVLRRQKGFVFTVSMTVNSRNFDQVEKFVDLALGVDAEPLISLVANPYETYAFQKGFLHFTEAQFAVMFEQIGRSLPKLQARGFVEGEAFLKQLQAGLKEHHATANSLGHFALRKAARSAFHRLPAVVQRPLRDVVQQIRRRNLEKLFKN
jgi:sulfatase maturation enzyme AslB (radical SAM superfamily)